VSVQCQIGARPIRRTWLMMVEALLRLSTAANVELGQEVEEAGKNLRRFRF